MFPTAPFATHEYVDSSLVNMDHLLGNRYVGPAGQVYRLVKLVKTGGFDIRKKALKWLSKADYTVAPCSTIADKIAGVGPAKMDLATTPTGAYVLIQESGRCTVIHGNDGTNKLGDSSRIYCVPDDDTDEGKVRGAAQGEGDDGLTVMGLYVSGTAADDAEMVIDLQLVDVQHKPDAQGAG